MDVSKLKLIVQLLEMEGHVEARQGAWGERRGRLSPLCVCSVCLLCVSAVVRVACWAARGHPSENMLLPSFRSATPHPRNRSTVTLAPPTDKKYCYFANAQKSTVCTLTKHLTAKDEAAGDDCGELDCGLHGFCAIKTCTCIDGYTGDRCHIPPGRSLAACRARTPHSWVGF